MLRPAAPRRSKVGEHQPRPGDRCRQQVGLGTADSVDDAARTGLHAAEGHDQLRGAYGQVGHVTGARHRARRLGQGRGDHHGNEHRRGQWQQDRSRGTQADPETPAGQGAKGRERAQRRRPGGSTALGDGGDGGYGHGLSPVSFCLFFTRPPDGRR